MTESLLEDLREHIAESSKHIDHAKGVLSDACDDFLHQSKPALKAGREATEDLVDHAEHTLRKYPKSSVGGAILVGIVLGFVVGWMVSNRD